MYLSSQIAFILACLSSFWGMVESLKIASREKLTVVLMLEYMFICSSESELPLGNDELPVMQAAS